MNKANKMNKINSMNWDAVKEDSYYQGRKIEAKARQGGDARAWERYARIKALKGSYVLAAIGLMEAGDLHKQAGKLEQAAQHYQQASDLTAKTKNPELNMLVGSRLARIYETQGDLEACFRAYDRLGDLLGEQGAIFLAADAYEHAAEALLGSGQDLKAYSKPISAWQRNAEYWEARGEQDDADWSRERIGLFKALHGLIHV